MATVPTGELVETIRIRDKLVDGGFRLINKEDLTENDITVEDKPPKVKPD